MDTKQIEEKFGKIIKKFFIPHLGWEFDNIAYICESKIKKNLLKKPKNILVLTNHNEPYIAKKSELLKEIKLLGKHHDEMLSASYYL